MITNPKEICSLILEVMTGVNLATAIENRKCPNCGTKLIQKGDWIFCPKNSTKIPDCDIDYHIAKNIKTGKGWSTPIL